MVIDRIPIKIVIQVILLFVDIPLVTFAWFILEILFISDRVLFVGIPFPL